MTHSLLIRRTLSICVAAMLVSLAGCGTLWGDKKPKEPPEDERPIGGQLSFHAYHPRAVEERGVATVYHISGAPVYIDARPLFTSDAVLAIKPYPVEGGMGLQLFLTPHGRNVWAQVTSQYADRSLAMLVDGAFRTLVAVPKSSSTGAFQLHGPFNQREAQMIADHVNKRKK